MNCSGLPDQVVGYGHLGDGNLHLNVSCAKYEGAILDRIEPYVYEWTAARRGSISAEHGLGQMKAECIGWALPGPSVDPVLLAALHAGDCSVLISVEVHACGSWQPGLCCCMHAQMTRNSASERPRIVVFQRAVRLVSMLELGSACSLD